MTDARFEDANETPLRLIAQDGDDLQVISTLLQDSVFPAKEMSWDSKARQFAILFNRFRWEDREAASVKKRDFERVQSVLLVRGVQAVATQGVTKGDPDLVYSLLSIDFSVEDDPAGNLVLTLAGDGAIRISVECIDVSLRDVTRPYSAPSGLEPKHPD